jgi:hypothetical protein
MPTHFHKTIAPAKKNKKYTIDQHTWKKKRSFGKDYFAVVGTKDKNRREGQRSH